MATAVPPAQVQPSPGSTSRGALARHTAARASVQATGRPPGHPLVTGPEYAPSLSPVRIQTPGLGWQTMRKKTPLSRRENFDVLGEFRGTEDHTDDSEFLTDRRRMAKSAGFTLALMILTAVAFAGGVAWGATRDLPGAPENLALNILVHFGFVIVCGLLFAAAVLALGMLAIGIPYARAKMAETRTRNSGR